jgi:hypothetical protein
LKPDLKDLDQTCVSRSLIILSSDVASRSGCAIESNLRGVSNVKEGPKEVDRVDTFRFAPQTKEDVALARSRPKRRCGAGQQRNKATTTTTSHLHQIDEYRSTIEEGIT